MSQKYLFVHFKERRTPDGEQVYFALSPDGYNWESVNDGNPVLWSMVGEKGVRDFTITRLKDNSFVILATDLSLAYCMGPRYKGKWSEVQAKGSHNLIMWRSEDLCKWSRSIPICVGAKEGGCCWAPDIIADRETGEYMLTWSSPKYYTDEEGNRKSKMVIMYTKTTDFTSFTEAHILYEKEDSGVIDSCMAYEDGKYYLFVKSDRNPCGVILLSSDKITGPFSRMTAFDAEMEKLEGGSGAYEAPCIYKLENGDYVLNLDFFGRPGKGQGYVPFIGHSLKSGVFERCDESVTFPYGFKHGTILPITEEEYTRIKRFDYDAESYNRGTFDFFEEL